MICAGVFMKQTPELDTIYVKKRLGFVKLAIQAGIKIIPVYHLGQSQVDHSVSFSLFAGGSWRFGYFVENQSSQSHSCAVRSGMNSTAPSDWVP